MSKRTIEPIRVVLPDVEGGYYRFGDLPQLIAEALRPDTEEADADPQGSYYVIRALDVMNYEKDLPRAATLPPDEPGYLHVVENSASKRPLEWRMGAVLDAGLVHLDWLNEWGESRNPPFVFSTDSAPEPQNDAEEVTYLYPMFERLKPRTPWTGGRMVDTDVLTLADAASMATKHAGEPVTIGDFLRAAARGEITLRAIVHSTAKVQKHDGGIYCNGGQENENKVPAGAIATLPLTACQHLAVAGRASWRTFDGFEMVEGVLQRYTKGRLVDGEPDFETVPDDCRVVGYDVHALADEYTAPGATQAEPKAAPVRNTKAKSRTWWEISSAYIVEVMQAGQYATAKELYRALEAKAGPNVPFDKGTGANRGSLFVREIAKPLSLKTVQNKWPALRELAKK